MEGKGKEESAEVSSMYYRIFGRRNDVAMPTMK